jgi:hypothetical protein
MQRIVIAQSTCTFVQGLGHPEIAVAIYRFILLPTFECAA